MMELQVDALTRVGPDTPMGNFFREFWMPVAKSSELVAGGAPIRMMVLGEKLIAFRDSADRIGLMDHRCPHRCASLFYGRNEEGGLRCVYHGWKFDVDGNCLEMPNVPPEQSFAGKVKAKTYPTHERNGLVWAYMGRRTVPPPLPAIAILELEEDLEIQMFLRECNWLQALEGDLDASHLGFLHHGHQDPEELEGDMIGQWLTSGRAPVSQITETSWGMMEAHRRPGGTLPDYWHYTQFMLPFWTMPGQDAMRVEYTLLRGFLPLDDTHTMNVRISSKTEQHEGKSVFFERPLGKGKGVSVKMGELLLPNSSDWLGRWRLKPDGRNDYLVDRGVQRLESYSGMDGIQIQDKAVTESMGPIVDRSHEHLTAADLMIVRTRRRLLALVSEHAASGAVPAVLDQPELYRGAVAGGVPMPEPGYDSLQLYRDEVSALGIPVTGLPGESAQV